MPTDILATKMPFQVLAYTMKIQWRYAAEDDILKKKKCVVIPCRRSLNMLLSVKDVSFVYQTPDFEKEALRNVSFEIEEGEFISLVGPSGWNLGKMWRSILRSSSI